MSGAIDQRLDRVLGTLVGLACGDALGYPTEFSSVGAIRQAYGPDGITDLAQATIRGGFALFTDDTQMSIAALEGLLEADAQDIDVAAPFVAEHFVEWARNPVGGHRSPGGACMAGCGALSRWLGPPENGGGGGWEVCGGPSSGGCGSVMRSAPYGLYFRDYGDAILAAARHSSMTHRDPMARSASAALAAGVWHATRVTDTLPATKLDIASWMMGAAALFQKDAPGGAPRSSSRQMMQGVLNRFPSTASNTTHWKVVDGLRGWAADECIACALWCFLRGNSYVEVVRLAANTPGDSDSIACVAGALAGAFYGFGAIPESWALMIERGAHLRDLAVKTAAVNP